MSAVPKSFMANTRIELEFGGANRHQSSVGNVSGLASCQVREAGSDHCGKSSKHLRKFRVGTLNVNTLRGRVRGSGNTIPPPKVDVCCTVKGKDTRYKLYWSGNDKGTAGVGQFVAEEWIVKVFVIQRVSDRIILVKLIVGQRVVTFLSVYAPQGGCAVTARIPASEFLIPCGDWNGHQAMQALDTGKCMVGWGMAGRNQMLRVRES